MLTFKKSILTLLLLSLCGADLYASPKRKRRRVIASDSEHSASEYTFQIGPYDPSSPDLYKLSRSRLELFLDCPLCFYLLCRLGIKRPSTYPYTLNLEVDRSLKNKFDKYRLSQTIPKLLEQNGIHAKPFEHLMIPKWRDSLNHGIRYVIPGTNIMFYGGIDDIWVNMEKKDVIELIVVDYKATAKNQETFTLKDLPPEYFRQVEMYQWLFRQNGFTVSNTAYFVYCNGRGNSDDSDDIELIFYPTLISYEGNDSWVTPKIMEVHKCLQSDELPCSSEKCEHCKRYAAILRINKERLVSHETQTDSPELILCEAHADKSV
jgi:hypothetical protein